MAHLWTARPRGRRIVEEIVHALRVADGKDGRICSEGDSPIPSNGCAEAVAARSRQSGHERVDSTSRAKIQTHEVGRILRLRLVKFDMELNDMDVRQFDELRVREGENVSARAQVSDTARTSPLHAT